MDVLIVGGGVIGVACAHKLAKRGATVTVVERYRNGHGCSFGNAGWLTPSQGLVARAGVGVERWSAEEVRGREPAIGGPTVGGYFFPDDAQCKPYEAVRVLADEATAAGVRFVEDAEVYAVSDRTAHHRRIVHTTAGDFSGDQIVLAVGSWSEAIGRMLGLRIPVLGAKGYSLLLPKANPHP